MIFVVKKGVDLSKYGFDLAKEGDYWYWYTKRKGFKRGLNAYMENNERRLIIQSASSDFIASICEMYKNDDIIICDNDKYVTMRLTEEEAKLIERLRKENSKCDYTPK